MPRPVYTQVFCEKPNKCLNKSTLHSKDSFKAIVPIIAHMQLQTSRNDFFSRAVVWCVYSFHTPYSV